LTDVGNDLTNVFKQPIPQNPTLAPNSAAIISRQLSCFPQDAHTEVNFGFSEWNFPVYYTDSSVSKTTYVQLQSANCDGQPASGGATSAGPIRWRSCMTAGASTDAPIAMVDLVDRCYYEGWGWGNCVFGNTPRAWALGGLPIDDANQVWDEYEGVGGTAGGTLTYSAKVWPDEISAGYVGHALCFATDWAVNNPTKIAAPFWHCDGTGTHEDDLFQGMRVQLNPSYDISGLPTYKRYIAQAMKDFGMYDHNSNVGHWDVGGVNPAGYVNNCWSGVLPADVVSAKSFRVVPVAQFRVLAVTAWNTPPAVRMVNNSCISYGGTSVGAPPTISTISPATGGSGTTVSLTGTNMSNGYNVRFGNTVATNMNVVSSTLVTCTVPTIPTGASTYKVSYRTTNGGLSNLKDFAYTVSGGAPTLSAVSPSSGTTSGGTAVTLTGTNLTGCSAVSFGGTAATGIVVDSSTQVRCTSPAKSAGEYSVIATTSNGVSNGVNFTFSAPVPTLSQISPTTGPTVGGTPCTLTGTGLMGCTAISFGGTAATAIVVDGPTQVRCSSPAKSAGTYSVTATTAGGTSGSVNYTYSDGAQGYTTTLYSPADAYVKSNSTNFNSGTSNLIIQKNASLEVAAYIKFDLSSVSGATITSATLGLCQISSETTATTEKVYSCTANDSWIETGTGAITWGNKPAFVSQVASFSSPGPNAWALIDVTSYVNSNFNGDKLVTLVIRDDANLNQNRQYYSDETGASTSRRPYLRVISQ